MSRYILRFRGQGKKPAHDVAVIRALPGATVVDDTNRMLLVEAPADELQLALKSLPDWVMTEEQILPLPDPRPRVHHPPAGEERE
ncbi:MAG: hypothetical protein SF339_19795 [Blastocatellia bacterium]|nr:hypothetical protein [Blastocatellia bacterium]